MTGETKITAGTTFIMRGETARVRTVVDIEKTYNMLGELVRIEYVATHEFSGQTVISRYPAASILRGNPVFPPE